MMDEIDEEFKNSFIKCLKLGPNSDHLKYIERKTGITVQEQIEGAKQGLAEMGIDYEQYLQDEQLPRRTYA